MPLSGVCSSGGCSAPSGLSVAILYLSGTRAQLEGLLDIPGFYLDHRDVRVLDDGRFRVSANLPESQIPAIEALGVAVEVEVTDAEWEVHMASFQDDGPPIA